MIQPNELRRNCYVDWNGEYGKIKAICEDEVLFYCGEEALFSDIEPIPLAEELLLKCGFSQDGGFYYIGLFESIYMKKPWKESDHFLLKTIGGEVISKLKYLHQLQNLYWCLTNQELEINL